MAKVAVVFWSGTGNTEAMAELVAQGVRSAGGEAELVNAADFGAGQVAGFDAFAFGCPAMGVEVLEETEFAPMYDEAEPLLGGRRVALFGSYDWGVGEWMEAWEQRAREAGLDIVGTAVANLYPDDEAADACLALGRAIAG